MCLKKGEYIMNKTIKQHAPIVGIKFPRRAWTTDKTTGTINSHPIATDDLDRRKQAINEIFSKPKLRNRAA